MEQIDMKNIWICLTPDNIPPQALNRDFDTKCAWWDKFFAIRVYWNVLCDIKFSVCTTSILAYAIIHRRTLVTFRKKPSYFSWKINSFQFEIKRHKSSATRQGVCPSRSTRRASGATVLRTPSLSHFLFFYSFTCCYFTSVALDKMAY